MHEWKEDSRRTEQPDLEERLTAYYGPQLREQPLSSASWQRLRSQLGPQRPPKLAYPTHGHCFNVHSIHMPACLLCASAHMVEVKLNLCCRQLRKC